MRKLLVLFSLLAATAPAGEWITSGGNPARTGLSDEYAPGGPDLLWSGTQSGWFGLPVFISADKLVTMRFQSIDYAPIVCHDLFTGETLWTRDFPGANSRSVPIGLRDNRVYAINFQESRHDTLYCLDAENGEIVWRGRMTVEMSISESVTFAENGDLLVNASDFRIARLDHTDGDTVWTTYRLWPVTGSTDICVYESTAYAWWGDMGTLRLAAFRLSDGRLKDTIRIEDTHPGGPMAQAAPMVGPDGTIYAHKVGDNVTAIRDDGDSLRTLWVAPISGEGEFFSPFSHFAVGPDSTIYAASYGRIIRLNPSTGAVMDSSDFVQDTSGVLFNVRLAVDAAGQVFLATGQDAGGLYCFSPDLRPNWFEPIRRVNTSGPAIGPGGILAVAGDGTELRVYAPAPAVAEARSRTPARQLRAPGIVRNVAPIRWSGPAARITIRDITGALVSATELPGPGRFDWDCRAVPAGVYLVRAETGSLTESVRITVCR
ncbi:MAG: PQQ-binding-like beta-propeller repeat protein [bacterium]